MAVQISGNDITVPRDGSFTRNVTIGGTLTYEDVTNIDSVGLVTARNGIEIGARPGVAASISVDGNMIVSGISTFNSRVLLGTTTEGASGADQLTVASSSHGGITIRSGSTSNGNLMFSDGTSGAAEYAGYVQYEHDNNKLNIGANGSTKLRIDSTGRLLLNTTTEGNAGADDLTIGQISGSTGITVRSGTTNNGNLYFSDGTSGDDEYRGSIQYQHANNSLHIATNAVERLIIDSKGQLSSGGSTTAFGGTSSLNGLQMYYETDSGLASFGSYSSGGSTNLAFYTNSGGSAATEKLRIESDGDIGLATNSPNATGFSSPVISIGKSGNAYAVLELQGTQTSDGAAGVLVCHNSSGSSRLSEIQFNREGANNTGSLSINTYGSGSAAEVARFNASKQLLIGTTSNRTINSHAPRLQISGTDYSSSTVSIINNANDGNGAYLFLAKQRSGSAGGSTIVNNGDIIGQIRFSGADGTDLENPMAYIECRVDGTPGSNDVPGRLSFYTTPDGSGSPGERIRIEPSGALTFVGSQLRAGNTNSICSAGNNSLDLNYTEYFYLRTGNSTEVLRSNSNGDIMAGRTSVFSGARLSLEKGGTCLGIRQSANADNNSIEMTHLYATSGSYQGYQISFRDASGNQRGSITNNTSTTTYNTSSDYRLKENEVLISDGITRLKTLKPYRFNWKNDTDRRVDGFFAHEVTDAVPEAVIGEKDASIGEGGKGYQQIDHSKLVPLLTAALQEAVTEIESLKSRLDAAGL